MKAPASPSERVTPEGRPPRGRRAVLVAAGAVAALAALLVVAGLLGPVAPAGGASTGGASARLPFASGPATELVGPGAYVERYQGRSGRLTGAASGGAAELSVPRDEGVSASLRRSSISVAREDGDLVLRAEIAVERAGSYWAYAELRDGAGRPIAFARRRLPGLVRGRHALALVFGGAIIRAANLDGPYVVTRLELDRVDAHPPRRADYVAQLPVTAPLRLAEFH